MLLSVINSLSDNHVYLHAKALIWITHKANTVAFVRYIQHNFHRPVNQRYDRKKRNITKYVKSCWTQVTDPSNLTWFGRNGIPYCEIIRSLQSVTLCSEIHVKHLCKTKPCMVDGWIIIWTLWVIRFGWNYAGYAWRFLRWWHWWHRSQVQKLESTAASSWTFLLYAVLDCTYYIYQR